MQFVLTTWAGEKLVRYEPIYAPTADHAVIYAQGVLTERTKGHEDFLIEAGVRYCVDNDVQDPGAYILNPKTLVGTWHLVQDQPAPRLVWEAGRNKAERSTAITKKG